MREEVGLWAKQAEADLKTARRLLEDEIFYASVFFSQQAAEKFLKALWVLEKRELPPRTHNLVMIARELGAPGTVVEAAAELTPEYLLARYPNMDVGTPEEIYTRGSAEVHLQAAELVAEWVKNSIAQEE